MHCIIVFWYCKKNSLQKRFCKFSALCVIVLVFFYYTILSYTTMVKGCVLCLVRTQRSCAWLLLGCGCSRQRWQWKAFFLALEYPSFSVATHIDLTSLNNCQYFCNKGFKVLFTDRCRWQNFHPSLLHLVNNCVESIYKPQKTRTNVLPYATVDE